MTQLTLPQRAVKRLSEFLGLATVTAISPGKIDDGMMHVSPMLYELERTTEVTIAEFTDALDAWRTNPLARRIVTLISAYVVGDGIMLSSTYKPLANFLKAFWTHPQNHMPTRQREWCDELTRTGELFIVLHTNQADGMTYLRAISAGAIDQVETAVGDYETELSYHESVGTDDPDYPNGGRTWLSPTGAQERALANPRMPVMLHFTINRPVGAVRGESDLEPILAWLRRYNKWLEDRVRLNAAIRAFLWIVKVPPRMVEKKTEQWRNPPEPGNVVITEAGAEDWTAVTPNLQARDASADGRAIRWMIAAGGPGTALVDFGEGEDANLATAKAMAEQRQKIMRQRQFFFAELLQIITVTAYNRARALGAFRGRECTTADLIPALPDISPADNAELATAAASIAQAFSTLAGAGATPGPAFIQAAVRMVMKFAGETLTEDQIKAIVAQAEEAQEAQVDQSIDQSAIRNPQSEESHA